MENAGLQKHSEAGLITSNQIAAARVAMTRFTAKEVVRFGLKFSRTNQFLKKPAETRMGSGKGAAEYWVAAVKPGRVMFEMAGVSGRNCQRGI